MAEKTEDLHLPIAVVSRIIKEALPDGVNVSKEARVAVARAASVFVLYATSTANGFAQKAKRKTLLGSDVVAAMRELEFEEFVDPLKGALAQWKEQQKSKKQSKSGAAAELDTSVDESGERRGRRAANGDASPPPAKKQALEAAVENDVDDDDVQILNDD